MKSIYQLDSAQELTPEIIEAIQKAFGDQTITITIEGHGKTSESFRQNQMAKATKKIDTSLAESVIDIIFDQLSRSKVKK